MTKLLFIFLLLVAVAEITTLCMDNNAFCYFKRWNCDNPTVQKECAKTCGLCDECRDVYAYCGVMRSQCYWNPTWAQKYCRHTCGFCTKIPTNPPTQFPPSTYRPSGSCGIPDIQSGRVIAGTTAKRGAWPWQVLLKLYGRPMCGGSIVSPNWIVTAAHCVHRKSASSFLVRVGEHDTQRNEGSEVDIHVSRIIVHPYWDTKTFNNDIAMMKLAKPITFDRYVKPVCLPSADVPIGTKCYITGWGKTTHPGSMTTILQQTDLPVVSNNVCEQLNKNVIPVKVTDAMICGGSGGGKAKSGCHGDSGGPFVCEVGNRWELHGAVSHGSPRCDSKETYTVFAKVHHFRTWIKDNMNKL